LRFLPRGRIRRNQPPALQRGRAPMIRSVWSNVRRHDILGKVAVGGGEIPAVLRDHALDGRNLAKPLDLQAGHPGITVVPSLVLARDLHYALGSDIRKRISAPIPASINDLKDVMSFRRIPF